MRESRSFAAPLTFALFAFALSACGAPQPETSDSIVAPGDCLLIVFDQSVPFGLRREVDSKGEIELPLHVKLHAAGVTPAQLEQRISISYHRCFGPPLEVTILKGQSDSTMRAFWERVGWRHPNPRIGTQRRIPTSSVLILWSKVPSSGPGTSVSAPCTSVCSGVNRSRPRLPPRNCSGSSATCSEFVADAFTNSSTFNDNVAV